MKQQASRIHPSELDFDDSLDQCISLIRFKDSENPKKLSVSPKNDQNFKVCKKMQFAACSDIGERDYQEDRVVCIEDFNSIIPPDIKVDRRVQRSFFAVYDGHGGGACSTFLAETLHIQLALHPELETNPEAALTEVWHAADIAFLERCQEAFESQPVIVQMSDTLPDMKAQQSRRETEKINRPFPRDGSTALVCFISGDKVYVTNCGDSAGYLVNLDNEVTALSNDHGTLNEEEVNRIKSQGGTIRPQYRKTLGSFPCCCSVKEVEAGKPRVYPGGLLVTRAFGDFHSKLTSLGGVPGTVIPDFSSIKVHTIQQSWDMLLMASDGVWDALSVSDVVLIARRDKKNHRHESLLSDIVSDIVASSIDSSYWDKNGASADNTSLILLKFLDHT